MTDPAARWREVDRLVDAALDLPHEHRASFLETACAGDTQLRSEVDRLLRSCVAAADFLETPAAEYAAPLVVAATPASTPVDGLRFGPYRVVAEAGRGGMGAVYLAERDDDQFSRRVALKVVRGGLDGDVNVVRRFVEERQILASLEHPNIARLLDGGVTTEGLPYFAMEFVDGTRLDLHCDARRLTVNARLELFASVCDAVQYAHGHLVVHRDLKPSNILVTEDGAVKLLDFGIAKLLAPNAGVGASPATRTGLRLMTPEYASPEQQRGEAISTTSDVYSLGVVLYELLAGRRPNDPVHTRASEEAAAQARTTTVERLRRTLAGDLGTIVAAATRAEPDRRYGTAEQLGADVRRYLTGLPVSARGDTWSYRASKFVRRHRVAVGAFVVIVFLLAGSTVMSRAQSARIARERDKAEQVSSFLVDLLTSADPYTSGGRELTARVLLDSGAARVARGLTDHPEVRAQLMATMGQAYYGLGMYDDARQHLESAIVIRRRLLGDEHASVLRSANYLAVVQLDGGRPAAAETLYRQLLPARRRVHGANDPAVARTLNGLALSLLAQGRAEQAEPVIREALAIDRGRTIIPLELGQSLNNLGRVLMARGSFAAAESAFREAESLRRAQLGDGHPEVDNAVSNVASALAARGDFSGASRLMDGVLTRKRRSMGARHPDVASDMARHATILLALGQDRRADALYVEALAVQQQMSPESQASLAASLSAYRKLRTTPPVDPSRDPGRSDASRSRP